MRPTDSVVIIKDYPPCVILPTDAFTKSIASAPIQKHVRLETDRSFKKPRSLHKLVIRLNGIVELR